MNSKTITISIFVILFVVGGIYFLINRNNTPKTSLPESTTQNPVPENKITTLPPSNTADITTPTTTPYSVPKPAPDTAPIPAPSPIPVRNPITHNVTIQNFAFQQSSITIKKGDTVVWTNKDSAPHTVTGTSGGPNSSTLKQNQIYSFNFNSVGSFSYYCKPHPFMMGTVIVTN